MSLTDYEGGFVDASLCPVVSKGRGRLYRSPIGDLPSVTTVLKVLGLATEGLIKWSANEERKAVLEACAECFAEGVEGGPAEFAAAVEERIGKARAHQKQLAKGAEIGTAIHNEIQRRTRLMLGLSAAPEAPLSDQALWAVMSWEDWLKGSGLKPYRCEQPVWDEKLGVAGTIDLLAHDTKGLLGVVDYKSGKGIYDEAHIQTATYIHCANNFEPVDWGMIVRVPKNLEDPQFEVKQLGQMYDRVLTVEQLVHAFTGAKMAWDTLLRKE